MGGHGSGRKPDPMNVLKRQFQQFTPIAATQGEPLFLPNHSGDHSKGSVLTTPVNDTDIVNKAYVDSLSLTGGNIFINANNIAINAFRIAINGSLTVQQMIDGFVDEFEDQTGVDDAASTGENYDATGDYYTNETSIGTNLVSHYKMNDNADNNTVTDDGSAGDNLAWDNGLNDYTSENAVTGKINGALEFDGTDDRARVAKVGYRYTDSSGTIACWIYVTGNGSAANNWIFGSCDEANTDQYMGIVYDPNDAAFQLNIGTGTPVRFRSPLNSITQNTWYHIAVSSSGSAHKMYINGAEVTKTYEAGSNNGAWWSYVNLRDNIIMGHLRKGGTPSNFFQGYVDDIRVYSNQLTDAEIADLYNSGNGTENTTADMSLISETFTAEEEPDTARIVVLLEEVDAVTIGTDIIFYLSKDGGTTWDEVTPIDEGNFNSSTKILVGQTTLTSTGVSMKYRVDCTGDKQVKLHGVAMFWD